jgi:UDP-glucose 4-epimerase
MSLLITGASGQIGSEIALNCNRKKIKSILLTRSVKKKFFLKKKFKNCKIITFNELNKKEKIQTLIHTASINDKVSNSKSDAVQISLNITKKIIKKIDLKRLKKVIYLSTAQVYGKNLIKKVSEKTTEKPINNYGKSRLATEKFLIKKAKQSNFKIIVVRISNVVGDPVFPNRQCLRLLPNDIKDQAKKFKSIILRSSGLQYRNFVSLKTTSEILLKLVNLESKNNQIFNLGGINTSVISFVKKFIIFFEKKYKKRIKLILQSKEPRKVKKLLYNDSKLRNVLKFKRKETSKYIIKNLI